MPGHVTPTDAWRALLADVAAHPARLERLDEPALYDPEFVFYLKGVPAGADGRVRYALLRREDDAFAIRWNPLTMPHTIRWVLVNSDQGVAAFAMPATCEPEGYSAEKRKGHVQTLAGGESARFETEIAYIPREQAAAVVAEIEKVAS
jgi:monosaccharide-transporting ATPase